MSNGAHIAASLRGAVDEGVALFGGVSEDRTARRPDAGAWSAREVIGHLIDSACNNHRRFVINQDTDRLIVETTASPTSPRRKRISLRSAT
jgi:hypothetical protein